MSDHRCHPLAPMCAECRDAIDWILDNREVNRAIIKDVARVKRQADERGDIAQADVAIMATEVLELAQTHGDEWHRVAALALLQQLYRVAS